MLLNSNSATFFLLLLLLSLFVQIETLGVFWLVFCTRRYFFIKSVCFSLVVLVRGCWLFIHRLYDVSGNSFEGFLDPDSCFGRCLVEEHSVLLSYFFTLFLGNNLLVFKITFVSYQYFLDIWSCMVFYLPHPVSNIIKAILSRTIIRQNYTLGASVVRLGDCSKPFLTSSVPDLNFDSLTIQINVSYFEVNAYINNQKIRFVKNYVGCVPNAIPCPRTCRITVSMTSLYICY